MHRGSRAIRRFVTDQLPADGEDQPPWPNGADGETRREFLRSICGRRGEMRQHGVLIPARPTGLYDARVWMPRPGVLFLARGEGPDRSASAPATEPTSHGHPQPAESLPRGSRPALQAGIVGNFSRRSDFLDSRQGGRGPIRALARHQRQVRRKPQKLRPNACPEEGHSGGGSPEKPE